MPLRFWKVRIQLEKEEIQLDGLRSRTKPLAFAVICGSVTLNMFNLNGLIYAQPEIVEKFSINLTQASWALSAYALTFGSFLLLAGRAGDMFGHKNLYSVGVLALSMFSALIAAIPTSFPIFCLIRGLQGMAAACTVPTTYAIISASYQGKAKQLAVAGIGFCLVMGGVLGSIRGIFGASSLGYRGILWISFGVSLTCGLLAPLLLPSPRVNTGATKHLDYFGAVTISSATAATVYAFNQGPQGWLKIRLLAPLITGCVLFAVFLVWELYCVQRILPKTDPLIPKRVWGYRNLVPVMFLAGFDFGGFFLGSLNGPEFLIFVQGESPRAAGIKFGVPICCGILLVMAVLGPFYNHRFFPPEWMLVFGSLSMMGGFILFSFNEQHTSYWTITFPTCLLEALGISIIFINYLNIVFASAPPEDQGVISGTIQTVAQISGALAFAIGAAFVSGSSVATLVPQYRHSCYVGVAFCGMGALTAFNFVKSAPNVVSQFDDVERLVGMTR